METSCRKKYKPSSKKWILASRCAGLRRNSALVPANAGLFHYAGNCPVRYIDPDGRDHGIPSNIQRILDNRQKLNELRVNAREIKSTGMAGNRDIHFAKHLRGDGCFARACIIADYLREKGYKVNYAYVNHPKMPNSDKRFYYHIAACVEIDGENYVVDPIYNHEGENSGLSKFEAWKNFQNPLDDKPDIPESGILSGYDENGNVKENRHIQRFYKYNKNGALSVPDYAEKLLEYYEKTYNPETKSGDLYYDGL